MAANFATLMTGGAAQFARLLGQAEAQFSVAPPGLPSTLTVGVPAFSFTTPGPFAISPPSLASSLVVGEPTFAFSGPQGFAIEPPSLPSTLTIGTPTFSFTRPVQIGEPVTLAEAKLAARLDDDPDTGANPLDAFIQSAITAAREQAEHITGRTYRRREFSFELEAWPAPDRRFPVCEPSACAISYFNAERQWQELAPQAFEFAPIAGQAEVAPALDTQWPPLGRRAVGALVRITFTAGPADPADVPEQVKLYIKAHVASWVSNPEAVSGRAVQFTPLLASLLDAERLYT